MKRILYYMIVLLFTFCAFTACKKMDSTYKKFIVPGGLIYAGKISSPLVYAGRYRIKISWLRGSDPSVVKARIFWNNFADSVEISIPPTGDVISYTIANLQEKSYSFVVKTYDGKGNTSVPVELLGGSYGDKFQAGIESLNRPIKGATIDAEGKVTIGWGTANISGGAFATEVAYTDNLNAVKHQRFPAKEVTSEILNVKAGTALEYKTLYLPDSLSIDTFYTVNATAAIAGKISKADWTATVDNAATNLAPNGPAKNAIDDNFTTYWHTDYTTANKPIYPHWLAVDMKKLINVTRVELTCRPNVTNSFTAFTMQGSLDGTTWTNYGTFTLIQQNETQSFTLTSVPKIQYIRVYATAGSTVYSSLAEFSAFGYE